MGFLSADTPQMATVQGGFAAEAVSFRSTLGQAEASAMQAQAFHKGESGTAFQIGHAKFVDAATRINDLLNIAESQLGEGTTTYVSQDSMGAEDMNAAASAINTNPM
ncbi:WXG100 family type VII secretion target [Mycolicibacterium neoaurum]|uniref:WXG100 family type VII secretion target n=1 Tax=Mycolicibacterium neoaurum TaxID=1795 RepID=UPI001F4CF3F4|nr:WXG100 family type VII secretion target [Mycolicibacterium neoaurum]